MNNNNDINNYQKNLIYTTILSILLTIIPFILVTYDIINKNIKLIIIIICAIIQIMIQLKYCLYTGVQNNNNWYIISLIFTIIVIIILTSGSLWIMYHLNYNLND